MNDRQPWERRPGESAKAYERFLWYRDFGPQRRYAAVAERFGVAERTVKDMAYRHRWTDRLVAAIEHDRAAWREELGEHILRARQDQIRASNDLLQIILRRLQGMEEEEIPAHLVARILRDLSSVYDGIAPPSDDPVDRLHVTVDFGDGVDEDGVSESNSQDAAVVPAVGVPQTAV